MNERGNEWAGPSGVTPAPDMTVAGWVRADTPIGIVYIPGGHIFSAYEAVAMALFGWLDPTLNPKPSTGRATTSPRVWNRIA